MSAKQQLIAEAIRDAKTVVGELIDGKQRDRGSLQALEVQLQRALELSDEVYQDA